MPFPGTVTRALFFSTVLLTSGAVAPAQQDGDVTVIIKAKSKPVSLPTLLVMCDLACDWKLDGEVKGHLDAGGSAKVKVEPGQHMVEASTEDGTDQTKLPSKVNPSGQTLVSIELWPIRYERLDAEREARAAAAQAQVAREQAEQAARDDAAGYWTDPATGLMWTKKDSGRDVGWQQARDYCRNLRLGDHSDWRLPDIEELQSIYDPSVRIPGYSDQDGSPRNWHVKGNLKLSGAWEWSSTPGEPSHNPYRHSGSAWFFYFFLDYGKRADYPIDAPTDGWGRALCVRSNAEAMFAIGQKYENGEGVPRSEAQAVVWYRRSAELGNAAAQVLLGFMYEEGRGVPKDEAQGMTWLRKAAEQGNSSAQIELGAAYQLGQGAPQDYVQAASWFRKASEQGDADAQTFLGDLYENGNGVPKDYAEAYFWFLVAAANLGDTAKDKDRDETAARLTPADLSHVQERARKWFEDHPAQTNAQR